MKQIIFKNLCPIRHGQALQNYWEYMQTVGEIKGGHFDKIYGGKNYLTKIRQTKASIIVSIIE